MANPTRTRKVKGVEIREMKCTSLCGEWRPESEFHFRDKSRKTRSSRCRHCAAVAQAEVRRKKRAEQMQTASKEVRQVLRDSENSDGPRKLRRSA